MAIPPPDLYWREARLDANENQEDEPFFKEYGLEIFSL
jgi:hypothetical protein